MKASERMNLVLEYLNLGTVALAVRVGLSRTRIRDMIRNDAKMAPDIADAISANYPTISRDWLLYEKGTMIIRPEEETEVEQPKQEQEPQIQELMKQLINEQLVTNTMLQKQIEVMSQQNRVMSQQNRVMHDEFMTAVKMLKELGVNFHPSVTHDTTLASEPDTPAE